MAKGLFFRTGSMNGALTGDGRNAGLASKLHWTRNGRSRDEATLGNFMGDHNSKPMKGPINDAFEEICQMASMRCLLSVLLMLFFCVRGLDNSLF